MTTWNSLWPFAAVILVSWLESHSAFKLCWLFRFICCFSSNNSMTVLSDLGKKLWKRIWMEGGKLKPRRETFCSQDPNFLQEGRLWPKTELWVILPGVLLAGVTESRVCRCTHRLKMLGLIIFIPFVCMPFYPNYEYAFSLPLIVCTLPISFSVEAASCLQFS